MDDINNNTMLFIILGVVIGVYLGSFITSSRMRMKRPDLSGARPRVDKVFCEHVGYDFDKHGRCCFDCGEVMIDFGD